MTTVHVKAATGCGRATPFLSSKGGWMTAGLSLELPDGTVVVVATSPDDEARACQVYAFLSLLVLHTQCSGDQYLQPCKECEPE